MDAHQLETLEQQEEVETLKNAAAAVENGRLAVEASNQMRPPVQSADFNTKSAQKTLAIGVALVMLYVFTGVNFPIMTKEFEGQEWSQKKVMQIRDIIPILGTCIAMLLVDHIGRKV